MFRKLISGTLLVAGTTVGAGMLGIPLVTASAGFFPALGVTLLAWGLMLFTGLLFLQAALWMPLGSNLLSMSSYFLGPRWRYFTGAMFLFLYYCLLTAYFSAGAPIFGSSLSSLFQIQLSSFTQFAIFGLVFGSIIALGAKSIDRTNLVLSFVLLLSYILFVGLAFDQVQTSLLIQSSWRQVPFAMPVLFAAFGYHNLIPSLVTYFGKEVKLLRSSIISGTILALLIYLLWQWIVIGIIPKEEIASVLEQGLVITAALARGHTTLFLIGQTFAFFALITSLLGVAFSMVDFLADGTKIPRWGVGRLLLTLATLLPPFIFANLHPRLFEKALGLAGGIGEAILNGLIPIALVWIGLYHKKKEVSGSLVLFKKRYLTIAGALIILVMGLEIINLI